MVPDTSNAPRWLQAADVDGDGDSDALVTNWAASIAFVHWAPNQLGTPRSPPVDAALDQRPIRPKRLDG